MKNNKKTTVGELLRKYNLLTKKIYTIDYHMEILKCRVDYLQAYLKNLQGKEGLELANLIVKIYDKCDQESNNYDMDFDTNMIRFGLHSLKYPGGHNHNKWNNGGLLQDDGFGFGTEIMSLYDDYVDFESDLEHENKNK